MKLLIAEKPKVAKEQYKPLLEQTENETFTLKNGYLQGQNWIISWCYGHLVGLSMPEDYGWTEWKLETLPMIPDQWKMKVNDDKKDQYNVLKSLVAQADLIVNGTDAGREGELIYRLVIKLLNAENKQQKRLWLNSTAMVDMVKAWKALEPLSNYDRIYDSAISRSIGDWLIGLNATRGYSIITQVKGLSVGRVQTPTLALIVKRDEDVENWKQTFFYQLTAQWKGLPFTYFLDKANAFETPAALETIKLKCNNQTATLYHFKSEKKNTYPPNPFYLGALQKLANKQFGFSAAETLEYTQSLYESKLVTYPRTDSEYLPENMKDEVFDLLDKLTSSEQKKWLRSRNEKISIFNSEKVSDHFAIIPTGETPSSSLSANEQKIYQLIYDRFIVAFGKPYEYNHLKLELNCNDHLFESSIRQELNKGFKNILADEQDPDEEEQEPTITTNLQFAEGDTDLLKQLTVAKRERTKPKHYTEATLITAMETAGRLVDNKDLREAMKKGLGTGATQGPIIETLKQRAYINNKGRYLISTIKGRELIKLVDDRIKSPELTGEWEYKLRLMQEGKYKKADFINEIKTYLTEVTKTFVPNADFKNNIQTTALQCPKCKSPIMMNTGGAFCKSEPPCGFKLWRTVAKKELSDTQLGELITKGKTKKIKGFTGSKGTFETTLVLNKDFKVEFSFDDNSKKK